MSDTLLNLVFRSDTGEAVRGVTGVTRALSDQRQELNRLSAVERLRAAQERALIADRQKAAALERVQANQSLANQTRAARAIENHRAAVARITEAQKRLQLVEAATSQEKENYIKATDRAGATVGRFAGMATIALRGVLAAVAALTAGVVLLGAQFTKALNVPTQDVQGVSTLVRNLQLSRREALVTTQEIRAEIARQGMLLPVSAGDISQLALTAQEGVARASGGDPRRYREALTTLASRTALLQAQTGASAYQVQNFLGDYLSGASVSQLQRQEFFRQSGLNTLINEQLGGRKLESVNASDRLDLLIRVLGLRISDVDIAEMSATPQAAISAFMDRIFDPDVGLLGFARDLDPTREGRQSAIDTAARTINLLIGSGGVLEQLGRIFPGADPMRTINRGLEGLNQILTGAIEFLKPVENSKELLGRLNLGGEGKIGVALANLLNSGFDAITNNPGVISTISAVLARETGAFIGSIHLGKAALALATLTVDIVGAVFTGGLAFFSNFTRAAGTQIGEAIANMIRGIADAVTGFINSIPGRIRDSIGGLSERVGLGGFVPIQSTAFTTGALSRFKGDPASFGDRAVPILQAIATEIAHKPTGSRLVIANSSERIFRDDAQARAFYGIGGGGARPSVTLNLQAGAVTIQQQPGEDAGALADRIVVAIEKQLAYKLMTKLA